MAGFAQRATAEPCSSVTVAEIAAQPARRSADCRVVPFCPIRQIESVLASNGGAPVNEETIGVAEINEIVGDKRQC